MNVSPVRVENDGNTGQDVQGLQEAQNHLRILLSNMPDAAGYLELRAFSDKGRGGASEHWIPVKATEEQLNDAVAWGHAQSAMGRGVFAGMNPRQTMIGTKAAVKQMTACFVDLDLEKRGITREAAMRRIESAPLAPSLIVNSGGGLHVHYFFKPTTDVAAWEALQARLTDYFASVGSDNALRTDRARVMRLTPFPNQKLETPRPTQIVRFFVQDEKPSIGELLQEFGTVEEPKALVARSGKRRLPEEIGEGGTAEYEGRNTLLFKEGSALRGRGWSQEEILSGLLAINMQRCSPPLEEETIQDMAERISNSYEAGDLLSGSDLSDEDDLLPIVERGEMRVKEYPTADSLLYGVGRGEISLLNSVTNVGKTTLLRGIASHAACGRPYPPVLTGEEPLRVLFLDLESHERQAASDLELIEAEAGFTQEERALIDENLHMATALARDDSDELPTLSTASVLARLERTIRRHQYDLVIVDTVSAGFTLSNENDNAEVNRVILRPLRQLARKCNAAVLMTHHVGKGGEGSTNVGAYKGRGASAFGGNIPTVYLLEALPGKTAAGGHEVKFSFVKVKGEKPDDVTLTLERGSRLFRATENAVAVQMTGAEKFAAAINHAGRALESAEAKRLVMQEHGVAERTAQQWGKDAVSRGLVRRMPDESFAPPEADQGGCNLAAAA